MRPMTPGFASVTPCAPSTTSVSGPIAVWMVLQIAGSTWVSAKKKLVQATAVVTLATTIGPNWARNLAKSDGALTKVAVAKITVDQENANRMTRKKSKR